MNLSPMGEERFANYRDGLARNYAEENVAAGRSLPDSALRESEEELRGVLSDGLATKGHFLYSIRDEASSEDVGSVWLSLPRPRTGPSVWIHDLVIHERFRRKGCGVKALRAVEEKARELGASSVGLHVFGHNRAARLLYEKAGFETTSIVMTRRLGSHPANETPGRTAPGAT